LLLSNRVKNLKPSPTLAVTARAAAMRAEGKDIIGLGAGEPDFDTPDHIKQAAIRAIEAGDTKYTAVDGTAELKSAIIEKFQRDNDLKFEANQILVSCGGKHSFYNLAQALLNPGDEVIIPAPYWVSYPPMVELAEGKPVIVDCGMDQHFKMTPAQLEAAISPKTRAVILNSPSNPTGAVYSADELKALGEVFKKYPDVLIVTDDIYEAIVWAGKRYQNILTVCPDLLPQTMVLNGVSKAYSMTGWRIGYAAGPADLIKAMKSIQSQSTSNPTSIAQAAAAEAIRADQSCIDPMIVEFEKRHAFVHKRLNEMNGVSCIEAHGAFYLFPDFSEAIARLKDVNDDVQFGEWLLENAGVAMVPGSAFGAPGHMRISFATSMENLENALARVEKALK
jgi:aspartate aminotransferase